MPSYHLPMIKTTTNRQHEAMQIELMADPSKAQSSQRQTLYSSQGDYMKVTGRYMEPFTIKQKVLKDVGPLL